MKDYINKIPTSIEVKDGFNSKEFEVGENVWFDINFDYSEEIEYDPGTGHWGASPSAEVVSKSVQNFECTLWIDDEQQEILESDYTLIEDTINNNISS